MQPCPRKAEASMASQLAHESHWREDGTCSYCGSISADAFFVAITAGCEIGPTDKDYKVYVDLVEPNPDELTVKGTSNAKDRPGPNWVPADAAALEKAGFSSKYTTWMLYEPRGPKKFGKFYFQHFTVDERKRFVDLLNAKAIKIGHPGHFYRLPFFCVREKK